MFSRERAAASPSVAIEKGNYRLRSRNKNIRIETLRLHGPAKLRAESAPSLTAQKSLEYDHRMTALLMFCAMATVFCFGVAYWLYTTARRG